MDLLLGRAALLIMGCLLVACVAPAPAPNPEPVPAQQSAPVVVVPVSSEDSLPSPHVVLNLPKTTAASPQSNKPVPSASQSGPAAKGAKPAPDEKAVVHENPPASPATTPPKSKATSTLSTAMLKEFPWLQYCQKRVEFGGAVQCDVDTLLAQPSARVQVYVREAKLARTLPDGLRIQLREGLPRLYRFFVVP